MASPETPATNSNRLLSLDFMRGFIMVLLALESVWLYEELSVASEGTGLHGLVRQFFHHPWHGLHFWDLIQPGFMYIAGVSMALSLHKQAASGMSWKESFKKILKRCGFLFFWSVLDYLVGPKGLQLDFSDVLTQLSFTTLIAFLIFRWSATAQILVCVGLLLLREILYRFTNIPGFDQPFTNLHNFTYGSDGAGPIGGLILTNNTLYGTANLGGSSGAGIVFSISLPAPPLLLTIIPSGTNVVLTWPTNVAGYDFTGSGYTLQSASAITGTFTNLAAPTSPYTNPLSGPQQFFRMISN